MPHKLYASILLVVCALSTSAIGMPPVAENSSFLEPSTVSPMRFQLDRALDSSDTPKRLMTPFLEAGVSDVYEIKLTAALPSPQRILLARADATASPVGLPSAAAMGVLGLVLVGAIKMSRLRRSATPL